MDVTNNSGVTAFYVLLPNAETIPHIIPLDPPLPSGTGASRTITFQICDIDPGTTHCFDLILADEQVEECCTIEVCVDLPDCDCMQFSDLIVECVNGDLVINFMLSNLSPDVFEHVFIFKPLPPDPNSGIVVTPDYFDFSGSPINPFTTVPIGPITISGAVPGTELCLLISGHNADLIECCSEELCFEVPDCDGTVPTGACCLPDGTCVVTTAADCQAQLGLYLGDDVPCDECGSLEPVGACCLADGSCVQVSAFECGNLMGIYIGDGVPCDECEGVTPRGACCLADGTCVQTSEPGCQSMGGFYLGDDTPCDECQSFFEPGACCLPDGTCLVVPGPKCLGLGGTYLGPGTGCDECPQMFDDCDFNQDGSVDVDDLLVLLSNWGPCEGCQADLDGDGSVNVNDLLMLLAQWDP
jgi:hypothetical protein